MHWTYKNIGLFSLIQNQPALEKDRYKIRQAFIAAPGNSLIVADYGQVSGLKFPPLFSFFFFCILGLIEVFIHITAGT